MQLFAAGGEDEDLETRALLRKAAGAFDSKLKPRANAAVVALKRARAEDIPSVVSSPVPSSFSPDSDQDATRLLVTTPTPDSAPPPAVRVQPRLAAAMRTVPSADQLDRTAPSAPSAPRAPSAPDSMTEVGLQAMRPIRIEPSSPQPKGVIDIHASSGRAAPPKRGPVATPLAGTVKPKVRVSLPLAIAAGVVAAVLTFGLLALLAGLLRG